MQIEKRPIDLFVSKIFNDKQIQNIVENWPIDQNLLKKMLVRHFRHLGILMVKPSNEKLILQNILHYLRFSKEIHLIIEKTNEKLKKRNK